MYHLFSSGIWRFMACRASEHWILHPLWASGWSTFTFTAWLGSLVHETGLSCWTWILGGQWGAVLHLWLRSKPADSGIAFWIKKERKSNEILKQINHEVKNTFYNKPKCKEYLISFLKIEYITYQADKANNSLPLCTQIQTETCSWWWVWQTQLETAWYRLPPEQ